MVDFHGKDSSGNGKFVCPSDRQLALRAKLHTGWSTGRPQGALKPEEQAAIISVIQRNEILESAERQRVGRLVDKVEKIKQIAAESGPKNCRLCGQAFGILGPSKLICDDCQKPVCSKCSIEINASSNSSSGSRHHSPVTSPCKTNPISSTKIKILKLPSQPKGSWLCKICLETREMWKKSGAWFYKGLPKYELPPRITSQRVSQREVKVKPVKTTKLGMAMESSEEDDEEEEETNRNEIKATFKLGNGSTSRFFMQLSQMEEANSLAAQQHNKKSPISPYSRQTSSSESSHTQHTQTGQSDWDASSLMAQSRKESNRRGSISSNFSVSETSSGNCNNQYVGRICKEPSMGWLELSLNYVEANHSLECKIFRARDLPPMDSSGLADPFCKVNIVTAEGITRQKKWARTKTAHKTRNPEFNETMSFLGVEPEELGNSILYAVLLDDDKYGHDFLGATKIQLSVFTNSGPCRTSVPLGSEDQYTIEAAQSGPWVRGQISLGLCYNTKRRALMVNIKRCVNLVSMDSNGYSDPFVKLYLKPDSHRKKYKTSIKRKNLNPVFNEEFAFETRPSEMDKQSLILAVWDKDFGKSNDFLGSLILGPNSKGRRLKQWRDCVLLPDHYHDQWHYLSHESPGGH